MKQEMKQMLDKLPSFIDSMQEVMKETKSGVVTDGIYIRFDDETWIDLDPSMSLNPAFDVKDGERVKVIIIKEC